jgi:hypothetical protein
LISYSLNISIAFFSQKAAARSSYADPIFA